MIGTPASDRKKTLSGLEFPIGHFLVEQGTLKLKAGSAAQCVSESRRDGRCPHGMELPTLTAIAFYLVISTVGSQGFTVEPAQSDLYVPIGGDAEFTVRPAGAIESGTWLFKGITIVSWVRTFSSIHVAYRSRVDLNSTSGSLELKSVNESDNGDYTVSLTDVGGVQASATITLHALEPVSTPNITSNASSFIEHNDTVVLTCVATGTDVSYTWSEDNSVISNGGRFELSASNNTLTITGVLRSDGPIICLASNAVSAKISEPFPLNVFYGPDIPIIIPEPDTPAYTPGTDVTLTCYAQSKPAAMLSWYLQGVLVHSGDKLNIPNVSSKDIGRYVCQAFNDVTGRYISSSIEVDVLEPVGNVSLRSTNSYPVEQRDSVLLTCSSHGTHLKREWFFNNRPIRHNDRITISGDILLIDPVNVADTGVYKCIVSNGLNNDSAETYLEVLRKYRGIPSM
ncbi:carcinoembryonic antigen-related cell adhesion molecule 1-like [Amblyraja radiata]|uniref:carcinoembryonic antigen-related cell adhesion molecule 1-like n=1 Tax=Amblyraja radiata TaxID=386614 RepID=UPI001402A312|nr:carcinoembryonic antigen-related cell adhesion molecule 1-like [Amblyraja radiata]